jgi:hypothetical protein
MSWKIALALCALVTALGSAVHGCALDECDQADNHVSDCALIPPTNTVPSGLSQAQTCLPGEVRYCQSQCINQASCTDLNASECFNQVSCNQVPQIGDGGADAGPQLSALEQCFITCAEADGGT